MARMKSFAALTVRGTGSHIISCFLRLRKDEIRPFSRRSGFHREAISSRAAGFHPSRKTDFIEKTSLPKQRGLFWCEGGDLNPHEVAFTRT